MNEMPNHALVDRSLDPLRALLLERNERAVEAFVEACLSLLDAGLLEVRDREQIGGAIEALDPTPGKPRAHLWGMWVRRWYSETNGELRP